MNFNRLAKMHFVDCRRDGISAVDAGEVIRVIVLPKLEGPAYDVALYVLIHILEDAPDIDIVWANGKVRGVTLLCICKQLQLCILLSAGVTAFGLLRELNSKVLGRHKRATMAVRTVSALADYYARTGIVKQETNDAITDFCITQDMNFGAALVVAWLMNKDGTGVRIQLQASSASECRIILINFISHNYCRLRRAWQIW